ncbi:hypothetical protein KC909_01070 [Candidatus Dojkabacteria bacterium]|uniref:Uncharacterized protein n=1 Tax=Candidatus Dojkabacteria bacterium TaxID=2099670 RepID=A0A955RIP0_9BACT|nr:hypothetical protein [Candidatus Dojkabacteria bacterium]
MNHKSTEQLLEEQLRSLDQEPDSGWGDNVEIKLREFIKNDVTNLEKESKSNSNSFILFNLFKMNNKAILFTLGISCSLFMLLGSSVGGYLIYRGYNNDSLSEEEKRAILTNVYKNNSESVLKAESGNYALASGTGDSATITSAIISDSEKLEYTYSSDKTTILPGSKVDQCKSVFNTEDGVTIYTWESYSFYEDGKSYYKSKGYTEDNSLASYALGSFSDTNSTDYIFNGGSYAVKFVNNYNLEVTVLEDTDEVYVTDENQEEFYEDTLIYEDTEELDPIESYFGTDVDVVGKETIDGVDYYLIQYSYQTDCDAESFMIDTMYDDFMEQMDDSTADDKIIEQLWVDTNTFEVKKYVTFLGEATSDNAIITTVTESDRGNFSFGDVSQNFEFEYDVDVIEIVNDESTLQAEQKEQLLNYVDKSNVSIITIDNESFDIDYLFVNEENIGEGDIDYINDRNFYPAGELGDKMYAEATRIPDEFGKGITEYISEGFAHIEGDGYISISIFDAAENSKEDIVDMWIPFEATVKNMKVDFGKGEIDAEVYTFDYSEEVIPGVDSTNSAPAYDDELLNYRETIIIFESDGYYYDIHISGSSAFDYSQIGIHILDLGDSADKSEARKLIQRLFD